MVREFPTVEGRILPGGKTMEVLCPHCPEVHIHGYTGSKKSHRLSHCKKAPIGAGYWIVVK
jgi:hypothetical protein